MALSPPSAAPLVPLALVRGQTCAFVGAAAVDLSRHLLTLYQFPDDHAGQGVDALLRQLQPQQILLPTSSSSADATAAAGETLLQVPVPAEVLEYAAERFDDVAGRRLVLKHCCGNEHALAADLAEKQLALSAAAALLVFVRETTELQEKSLQLVVRGSDNGLLMDAQTIACLELFHDTSGDHTRSLFAWLNQTRTQLGCRFLRSSLFQPLTDKHELLQRQDSVQELLRQTQLSDSISDFLQKLHVDLDSVTTQLLQRPRAETSSLLEAHVDCVAYLRHALHLLPSLTQALATARSDLLRHFTDVLSDAQFSEMRALIADFVSEDMQLNRGFLNFRTSQVFALRADLDPDLQLQRATYLELVQELEQEVDRLASAHGGGVRLAYSASNGFHLDIVRDGRPLPPQLLACFQEGTRVKSTTADVLRLNQSLAASKTALIALGYRALQPLLSDLSSGPRLQAIRRLKHVVGYLDFLLSLAVVAREHDLVRPEFADETCVQEAVNPLLLLPLKRLGVGRGTGSAPVPVPNDVHLARATPLLLLTGANMSGKSVWLRQVALLQVLAQVGSFLPARGQPRVRIVRRILTRVGLDQVRSRASRNSNTCFCV